MVASKKIIWRKIDDERAARHGPALLVFGMTLIAAAVLKLMNGAKKKIVTACCLDERKLW
jgi:uncharacterized membrane protein YjjP (DUF1212 family)